MKPIRQSNLKPGSRVRERATNLRRGTVEAVYTDRYMREEVAVVKWDNPSHPRGYEFVSQLQEIR